MPKISVQELQDGDVLLYHGTALISRLIRLFDGGSYSHAAIIHKGHITEALGSGITQNTVAASTARTKYVEIYRFIKQGQRLGSNEYPTHPLDQAISSFEAEPQRYAYEQILLLALLCSTRN